MRRVVLMCVVLVAGHAAYSQCQDYTDPITRQKFRSGTIERDKVEFLSLLSASDSLTLAYAHSLSVDQSAHQKVGAMAVLDLATGTDTVYVNREVPTQSTFGVNFRIDPKQLPRYRNMQAIRFYLPSQNTYTFKLTKKEQREWNLILNCILSKN